LDTFHQGADGSQRDDGSVALGISATQRIDQITALRLSRRVGTRTALDDFTGEWVLTGSETGCKHYSVDVSQLASQVGEKSTWGKDSIGRS
jgi:hypothetical protein